MKLYAASFSPNVKRVSICCHELGIPFETVKLDPSKKENRAPAYLEINPMGKIPSIQEDDGWALWESAAICLYLAEKHPEKGLLPTDLRTRGEVYRWMFWNSCHLEVHLFAVGMERMIKPMFYKKPTDQAVVDASLKQLERYLPVLNGALEGREYVCGGFTVADVSLGATLEVAGVSQVDLAPYANVVRYLARLQAREGWKKAS